MTPCISYRIILYIISYISCHIVSYHIVSYHIYTRISISCHRILHIYQYHIIYHIISYQYIIYQYHIIYINIISYIISYLRNCVKCVVFFWLSFSYLDQTFTIWLCVAVVRRQMETQTKQIQLTTRGFECGCGFCVQRCAT